MRDDELRNLFRGLRAEDRQATPEFDAVMSRIKEDEKPSRADASRGGSWVRRHRRWAWSGGLLAAAAVATVLLVDRSGAGEARFEEVVRAFASDPALGAWESPTAALLEVPGADLLRTVPTIGDPRWPGQSARTPQMNQL